MAVRATQSNDGTQSGIEQVVTVPGAPGWTDQQLIDWKRQAHETDGWTIQVQQGGKRITATKNYPASERAKDPNLPASIQRTFRIV